MSEAHTVLLLLQKQHYFCRTDSWPLYVDDVYASLGPDLTRKSRTEPKQGFFLQSNAPADRPVTTYSAEKARGERTSFQQSLWPIDDWLKIGLKVILAIVYHTTIPTEAKCTPHSQPRATNFTIHSLNDRLFDSFRSAGCIPEGD